MSGGKSRYIPPLVSGNRLEEIADCRKTLNEANVAVGGYIRVSTKKDSQLTSIENQKKYLNEWASFNGYNLAGFYTDIKSGAYSYLRNEMQQLTDDIRQGKIKGIITKEISRTSRDVMDILELKRSLADHGAFFISIKENYDSRLDDDEFLLVIHAALAQKERKTTAGRVKITQIMKAREGKTNVPLPAYGYKLSKDRQHLVIDEETSKIYGFIVEKFLQGWGQLKICKYLNSCGILSRRGSKWHTNSVKTILTNPVYLGITIYNSTTLVRDSQGKRKRVVRPESEWVIRHGTHEPLIAEDEFNKIQQIINEKKERNGKEWSCDKKYLLSGLLYCNVCKCKVYGSRQTAKSRKTQESEPRFLYFYVDQNRSGICDTRSKYWSMEKVDEIVLEKIKSFFQDKELVEERIKLKQHLYNKDMFKENEVREKLQKSLNKVNSAMRKQQEAYENGIISDDEYRERMSELRSRKNDISLELDTRNRKLEKVDNVEELYKKIRDKVMEMIDNIHKLDYETKEMIIEKIIKRIFIKSDYSVSIEYNFET